MKVVLTTLLATLLIQIGYFFWKMSAPNQPQFGEAPFKKVILALLSDWKWVTGFISTTIGWVLFVKATSIGDISLVQPLMSAGDLLLILMVVVFLKERLGFYEWIGVLITVIGAAFLTYEANDNLISNFNMTNILILFGSIIFLGIFLFIKRKNKLVSLEVSLAFIVGLCFGSGAILTKAMTSNYLTPMSLLINPILPFVIIANVIGLILLQAAFQQGRASVIVPIQLAMANLITVLAGIIVFAENITFIRLIGISLIIGGTIFLQFKNTNTN
jgi:uncharacterized membrane protein